MEEEKIAIYLTPDEVLLFKKFRQYQSDFEILEARGFFKFRNGVAICHRDHNGKFRGMEINTKVFHT